MKAEIRLVVTILVAMALLVGCDKKKPTAADGSGKTVKPTAAKDATPKAPAPKEAKPAAGKTKTPDTPPVQAKPLKKTGEDKKPELRGEASAEECAKICAHVVAISLEAVKDESMKKGFEGFGGKDCPKRCMASAKKSHIACMSAAKSPAQLAKCSF